MRSVRTGRPDRVVPLAVLAVLLLLSPAVRLWAAPDRPWWLIFALWAVLIGAIGVLGRGRGDAA